MNNVFKLLINFLYIGEVELLENGENLIIINRISSLPINITPQSN